MTKQFLTTVSALAVLVATPAIAATEAERTQNQDNVPQVTQEEMKEGWNDTKDTVSDAAQDVSDAAKGAYRDLTASLRSDNNQNDKTAKVMINENMTAEAIIGKPVYNANGDRVAKVKDIILDRNGTAKMVILGDGNFTGLGKTVAFDYNIISKQTADGDVIAPLTESMISNAADFSYDRNDYSRDVKVIPSNGYSVAELLDGQLVDQNKKTIAEVDNISFSNGHADQLIVGFNKILGLGGEQAALAFDDANLIQDGDSFDFQLSANQTARFESYKQTMTN